LLSAVVRAAARTRMQFSAGIVERSLAATAQLRRKTASDSLSEKWRHQDSMMIDGSTAALSKIRAMASLRRGLDLVPRGRHNDARLDHLNESDQICVSSPAAAAEEEQHSWRDTQAQLSVETLYARLEAADIPIPAGVSRQAMAFAVVRQHLSLSFALLAVLCARRTLLCLPG
jgi:hypothetical protein